MPSLSRESVSDAGRLIAEYLQSPESLRRQIEAFLRDNPGSPKGKIVAYLGLTPAQCGRHLKRLKDWGRVTQTGAKRGATYSVARANDLR